MSQPFSLGVNYWPRKKAMYWWSNFDAGEVEEEFALIREIGLNTVRIFLLWDDWMPTPDTVSKDCLNNLAKVCDIAEKNQLGLDVTFFTGHMSGPNWAPGWMLDGDPLFYVKQLVSGGQIVNKGYRNYFTDPMVRQAQRIKLETVVSEFKSHPAVWMWNLGNEPDLFAIAPDRETGKGWVDEMVGLIKSIDDQHDVTCGLHTPSLGTNYALRIDDTFQTTDVAVMHSYPMYTPWARHPLDPDFVPYTCALTSALCGKPTLMEEFGGCTNTPGKPSETWEWTAYGSPRDQFMASEEDLAEYFAAVLPKLVEVGATGAITWCFADYTEDLWDKPPCKESIHERFFGMVRPDGSLKPHAQVFKDFAATNPTVQPATRTVELDITPDEYYQDPGTHYQRLYEAYVKGL
jgi:endo-1,4-beta-mannosidase